MAQRQLKKKKKVNKETCIGQAQTLMYEQIGNKQLNLKKLSSQDKALWEESSEYETT